MRVHVVGLASTQDVAANRTAAVEAVLEAADDGAHLVVLPEYAACFDPRGVTVRAEALDGPFVTALREAAAQSGVVVIAGLVVAGAGPTDPPANVVVAVGPQGLLGTYHKVHLYDAFGQHESDRFAAGDPAAAPLVVDVDGLRVGVMTCYDLRFPESARRLVDAGATVIAVPAAWASGQDKVKHWRILLRARAIEDTVYVLGAAMQGRGVAGAPMVVDPLGVVLADPGRDPGERSATGGEGRQVAVADLDPAQVEAVRGRNPSLVNRRYTVVPRV